MVTGNIEDGVVREATSWTKLDTNATPKLGDYVEYRRINGMLELRSTDGYISDSLAGGTWHTIGTLPSAFIPKDNYTINTPAFMNASASLIGVVKVDTSTGRVMVYVAGASNSINALFFYLTIPLG